MRFVAVVCAVPALWVPIALNVTGTETGFIAAVAFFVVSCCVLGWHQRMRTIAATVICAAVVAFGVGMLVRDDDPALLQCSTNIWEDISPCRADAEAIGGMTIWGGGISALLLAGAARGGRQLWEWSR